MATDVLAMLTTPLFVDLAVALSAPFYTDVGHRPGHSNCCSHAATGLQLARGHTCNDRCPGAEARPEGQVVDPVQEALGPGLQEGADHAVDPHISVQR